MLSIKVWVALLLLAGAVCGQIVPASGIATVNGTANQIVSTPSGSTVTLSLSPTVIVPGTLNVPTNGAASTPPVSLTGTLFTGGSATTTKPLLLIEPSGTTSNNWNTNGTFFGINAASGNTFNFLDLQTAAVRKFRVDGGGGTESVAYTFLDYNTGANLGYMQAAADAVVLFANAADDAGITIDYSTNVFKVRNYDNNADAPITALNVKANGFIASSGTKFTISGCSAGTTVGGATAGTFVSGTTGVCTVVITMNGATGLAAPTGWVCAISNRTTGNLTRQTASSTTTCTVEGTTVTGDILSFSAIGY